MKAAPNRQIGKHPGLKSVYIHYEYEVFSIPDLSNRLHVFLSTKGHGCRHNYKQMH